MKVLVLGSGAREHALADALGRSALAPEVLVAPGNDAMQDVARCIRVDLDDLDAVAEVAAREDVAVTVAGNEAPLVRGVWDRFDARGLRLFGPSAAAARLEGSKRFAKEFMQRAGIPTARAMVFDDFDRARAALATQPYPLVVKADGLAAGKGVHIVRTRAEAEASLRAMLVEGRYGAAGSSVLLEECLQGPEVSIFALSDGYSYRILGVARDHKRAYDGDAGPNTGGMGAFTPVADVTPALLATIATGILAPTFAALVDEGTPFRGFLYAGLMLTARGPMVLEYNCRLGDPEAQVVLPCIQGDFLRLVLAAADQDLTSVPAPETRGAAVGVVLASEGYPDDPRIGVGIAGIEAARALGGRVYVAGARQTANGLVTSGGRIATVVGTGNDLATARRVAYDALGRLHVAGAFHRRDIGIASEEPCPNRASAS